MHRTFSPPIHPKRSRPAYPQYRVRRGWQDCIRRSNVNTLMYYYLMLQQSEQVTAFTSEPYYMLRVSFCDQSSDRLLSCPFWRPTERVHASMLYRSKRFDGPTGQFNVLALYLIQYNLPVTYLCVTLISQLDSHSTRFCEHPQPSKLCAAFCVVGVPVNPQMTLSITAASHRSVPPIYHSPAHDPVSRVP